MSSCVILLGQGECRCTPLLPRIFIQWQFLKNKDRSAREEYSMVLISQLASFAIAFSVTQAAQRQQFLLRSNSFSHHHTSSRVKYLLKGFTFILEYHRLFTAVEMNE